MFIADTLAKGNKKVRASERISEIGIEREV